MKIIKVNNCGECQYKDTFFEDHNDKRGYSISYKYCRYMYILTGEVKKIGNLYVIAEWCNLDDYEEIK